MTENNSRPNPPTHVPAVCPGCGRERGPRADACPRCFQAGIVPDAPFVWRFEIQTFVLLVALLALGLALARSSWILSVFALALSLPTVLRSSSILAQERHRGRSPGVQDVAEIYCDSFLRATLIVAAVSIAFTTVCTATGFAAASAWGLTADSLNIAMGTGGLAALALTIRLGRRFFRSRPGPQKAASSPSGPSSPTDPPEASSRP